MEIPHRRAVSLAKHWNLVARHAVKSLNEPEFCVYVGDSGQPPRSKQFARIQANARIAVFTESAMEKKPVTRKKKPEDFVQDERGQTQPADKEQAQSGEPQSPGQPAGGE